jgi:hypothetical protein
MLVGRDLRDYLRIVEFLQNQQKPDTDMPFWLEATNDWAVEALGLQRNGDEHEYFVSGVNLLAGNFIKGGHWLRLAENTKLDRQVWLFYRAWV